MRRVALGLLCGVLACGPGPVTPSPPPAACAGTPNLACFGRHNYVEYIPGALPIVVSVPHGGTLTPSTIPDRTTGTTVTDTNTIELGRAIAQAFVARVGRAPHLVVLHLRRTKLDANREIVEGAQGHADAQHAWTEYHGYVTQAVDLTVLAAGGRGIYVDLHGHGHAIARLELGYLLASTTLDLTDPQLNGAAAQSSLRRAATWTSASFADLLRGPASLGGLLAPYPSVPSPAVPSPGGDPYFTGGYSTERYADRLPAVQIEAHFAGVRDTASSRTAFAEALVTAIREFLITHLGLTL